MKRLLTFCILLVFLTGCNTKVDTEDSKLDVVQSGESYTYIVVRLEFIQQLKDLCTDSLLRENYSSDALYNQAVAQCTFEKMSILSINTDQVNSFINTYCLATSDRSSLTPEQLANVSAACSALGYPL